MPEVDMGISMKSACRYSNGRDALTIYQSGLGIVPPVRILMQARHARHRVVMCFAASTLFNVLIAKCCRNNAAVSLLDLWKESP